MTEKISELLRSAAGRTVPVVRRITDDQLTAPTPCSEYDVRALAAHLLQVVVGFQALAAKEQADLSSPPPPLTGDWRERFAEETDRLVRAWEEPGAEEGVSQGMGLPSRTIGAMGLGDLMVHGWDLARATGQPYELDPALVDVLCAEYAALAPTARRMGVFGEEVPVPADAGPFAALLGLTGRDPAWAGR